MRNILNSKKQKTFIIDLIFQSTFATREHSGIAFSNISVQVAPAQIKCMLRAEALSTSPYDLTPHSVTVDFSGKKCVSDVNGNFPPDGKLR